MPIEVSETGRAFARDSESILRVFEPEIRNEFAILSCGLGLIARSMDDVRERQTHTENARQSVKRLQALVEAAFGVLT